MRWENLDRRTSTTRNAATAPKACGITEQWSGGTVTISVSGVLDMLTSPQLEAAIDSAVRRNPTAVIIDLAEVDFLASAGMGVLVAARDKIPPPTGFAVVADGPATSRPLTMVGLADLIGLHATLAEARAAVGE